MALNDTIKTGNITLSDNSSSTEEHLIKVSLFHHITWWIVNTCGSIIGSIGTFVVLIVLLTSRRLRSKTTLLITSLIVSDFFMNTILQPARANHYNIFFTIPLYNSNFIFIVAALCYLSSLGNILAVSLERYIAVVFPFTYNRLVTTKVIIVTIAIIWTSSATVAIALHKLRSPEDYDRRVFDIFAIATFSLVLAALCIMYGQIFRIVAVQRRKLSKRLLYVIHRPDNNTQAKKKVISVIKTNIQNDKSTVIVSMLAMTFICLWLPTWVYVILKELLWRDPSLLYDERIITAEQYLVSIHLWNSSINWYIYCWKSQEFRKEFDSLIKKIKNYVSRRSTGL